jgi:hypothetical protein
MAGLHPNMKADIADLVTAVSLSGSEAAVIACLVDENIAPDPDSASALFERVREFAES